MPPTILFTTPDNYERFCDTGDDKFLGDIDLGTAAPGTVVIVSWEGGDRAVTIGSH